MDSKALADRLESGRWRANDLPAAARILRDVVPLYEKFMLINPAGLFAFTRLKELQEETQAAIDALKEKDDG